MEAAELGRVLIFPAVAGDDNEGLLPQNEELRGLVTARFIAVMVVVQHADV